MSAECQFGVGGTRTGWLVGWKVTEDENGANGVGGRAQEEKLITGRIV